MNMIKLIKSTIIITVAVVLSYNSVVVFAGISPEQQRLFNAEIDYYDLAQGDAGSGSPCVLPGKNNAEKVWNFFTDEERGYTPEQTAGILGNMAVESGVQPKRLQGTAPDVETSAQEAEGNSLGWGLVQWTPAGKIIVPLLEEDVSYEEIGTVEHQVDFLWRQLEGTAPSANEKPAGDHLKQQTTVRDATKSFLEEYERPADQSGAALAKRVAPAEVYFAEFSSGTSGGSGCASGDWQWPMEPVGTITSCFGPRSSPGGGIGSTNHKGLDISHGNGQILAADSGRVAHAGTGASGVGGGFGRYVIINHGDNTSTVYAHASAVHVSAGDQVSAGDHIADEGTTGSSTGIHLHFEIKLDGQQINPLNQVVIPESVNNSANCSAD